MHNISFFSWVVLFLLVVLPFGVLGGIIRYFLVKKYHASQYEHNLVDILTLLYSCFVIFITWLIFFLTNGE